MIKPLRRALAITLIGLASACDVAAAETGSESIRTSVDQTALEMSELTPSDRARAQLWGLSATEWQRYRELMAGIRGSISPATISPIEVLGIHARNDAERRRYAEQWAMLMREDAERILGFQRAYDEAGRLLYPGEQLIEWTRLPGRSENDQALRATDRVLLFARPDCPACDALLERLLARLERIAGIDVYLAGVASGDEQAIRTWASERAIRPEWVRTRKVTLNFEAGALAQLAPGREELPYLMRRRGAAVSHLPGSAL
jgi:integrating conjugative element protein (TIGR03759 family)